MFIITPSEVDFGEIMFGEKKKVSIELINGDSTKSELVIVENPSEEYIKKTKIKNKKLKPGKSTKIEFEVSRKISRGNFNASLTLEAKDKPESRVTIGIKGKIVKEKPKAEAKTKTKNS